MTVEEAIKYLKQLYPNGGHCWLDEQRIEAISRAVSAIEFKEKIRAEIERRKKSLKPCGGQGLVVTRLMRELCDDFLSFIDSMQEEEIPPKFPIISQKKCMYTKDDFTDEDRKVLCEDCKEKCEYNKKEEPSSEELEEAAEKYAYELCPSIGVANTEAEQSFKAGAEWQKEQFVKNRLAACDKQTEEEAEIERDFVMGIIEKEHCQPAFDDAIKYGMERMKQQMMAKAIDGDITFDYYGDDDKTYGCIAQDSFCLEDFGLKDRDKVKVIIIKED